MKWRVWITSYEGSYSIVEADSMAAAMAKGAKEQTACHTGEVVEINTAPEVERTTAQYRRLVRITSQGGIQWE